MSIKPWQRGAFGGDPSGANAQAGPSERLPTVTLPKGGGAIRGIGEKIGANPVTGSGSITVGIPTSRGRGGFGPDLTLSYDSGQGNGPFGFGWSLPVPSVQRKTDKGLPRYIDDDSPDVFHTGGEDLVPVLETDGALFVDETSAPGYTIHRYRPRIEGPFARIERWTRGSDGDVHWRSTSRENVLTLYGQDLDSRIADPEDERRVFAWLICETRDDKGNAVVYEYKREDGSGVDLGHAHEANRGDATDPRRTANRYLKRIRYGNRHPLLDAMTGQRPRFVGATQVEGAGWMFEVIFDYGEHDAAAPKPDESGPWGFRPDPFSSYQAGFEVRTCRLCRRVLMFHHFADEAEVGENCLVRSTDFTYSHEQDVTSVRNPVYTFIRAVTQSGYRRRGGGYLKSSLPKVEFEYTLPEVHDEVRHLDPADLENLPVGLDGATYRWTDLHGEGISGILTEQAGAWFYKRNLSPISDHGVEFAPLERVASKPNLALAGGEAQLMDLAGDGQLDLVVLDGPTPGFYEHDFGEGWEPHRPFTARLNRDPSDPNLKLIDLDGDGRPDVLITENDALVWHASLGEDGFGPARRVPQALDEERGPRLAFAEATETIFLADMTGDGLTDLVRIREAEVCYWPNLGYGRFGPKITMDNAPLFDAADQFDPKRLRLADIDGTGTADIIYLHREGVRLYFNQSGNSWSAPRSLAALPGADDIASVLTVDLLGNGTACLVWSSPLASGSKRPMRFVDLMGGSKPHLLVKSVNNLGAETRLHYVPSTKFYLEDKKSGRPWITRLPFPVHVVERVEVRDLVSGNRFVTRHAYHHGFFDGEEREFRGFGMVEQWDTEEFATLTAAGSLPAASNLEPASHVPPVLTKTWFHTGVHMGREHVSDFFAGLLDDEDSGEYYREPGLTDLQAGARLLSDTILPPDLTAAEEPEACRALKGMMLRQEVRALDGTARADIPYAVVEQNFTVRREQARLGNPHAVFLVHPREVVHHHYERIPSDPRITHTLTLEVGAFGDVTKQVTIAYQRRSPSTDAALAEPDDGIRQTRQVITATETLFTNAIDDPVRFPGHYRAPLPAESRTWELTGLEPETIDERFRFDEWSRSGFALFTSGTQIPYEAAPDHASRQKRLIECVRSLYRKDDLTSFLPLAELEALGILGESYKMALTPGLIAHVFERKTSGLPEALLPSPSPLLEGRGEDEGGYVALDGAWWIPSGRLFFDPAANAGSPALTAAQELATARAHFYLPRMLVDPFGHSTTVSYDGPAISSAPSYDLLVATTSDPLANTVIAVNDYRVLQPSLVTDPNRNRAAIAFDALGLVVATAVMGKDGEALGDVLDGFDPDPTLTSIQAFVADPIANAGALLGRASTRVVYDFGRFERISQVSSAPASPAFAATIARETHVHDGAATAFQVGFAYSDGFGREVQKKVQAEAGEAPQRLPATPLSTGDIQPGELVRDAQGASVPADTPRRWVGSGRAVFNNKGKPVKQYEPFFSATPLYEAESDMTDTGFSPVLFYDPVERVVATLHPNDTYDKVVFDAWQQTSYDANDTVAASGLQTGDPRTDPDIAGYVRELFKNRPAAWQTWYAARIGGQKGAAEREAAQRAEAHADTPTVVHLDVLGRPFLTLADNGPDPAQPGRHLRFATRVELDVEGNQRAVRDAVVQQGDTRGRIVMRYDYDMLGTRLHEASMEAGERWILNDVSGHPIRAWDTRRFVRRMTYDELRRPTGLHVTENGIERLAERTVHGEGQGDGANHRTRMFQVFDGAGVLTSVAYDYKGNLLERRRELLPGYDKPADWALHPPANGGTYVSRTTYDALNRPVTVESPDGSVYRPTFNAGNALDKVDVNLRGAASPTAFVANIDYNAKGQRTRIAYAKGVETTYEYDAPTFRLRSLTTTRPPGPDSTASLLFEDPSVVQALRYTYDPVGNITHIEDAALRKVHHGQLVEPAARYTYDALYRLTQATGREHVGQGAFDFAPPSGGYRDYPFVGARSHPNDLHALRNYTETYAYDPVGNFERIRHATPGGDWTRSYVYDEPSLLEGAKKSNRLSRTRLGNGLSHVESYTYTDTSGTDVHGCMTAIDAMSLHWDFEDQLDRVDLGGGGTAYYVYDAGGQRVRKVIEAQGGGRQSERVYLGEFEIYREYTAGTVMLERESLHVMDDKQRIALVDTQTVRNGTRVPSPSPEIRYQLGNHLDSASVELDVNGALVSYEEYHPYGTTAFQAGRSAAEVSLRRYRYTGKERDEESGFCYHGARYYSPLLGRWASCDPAHADGLNFYLYVRANPVRLLDRTGLAAESGKQVVEGFVGLLQSRYHYWIAQVAKPGMTASQVGTQAMARLQKELTEIFGAQVAEQAFSGVGGKHRIDLLFKELGIGVEGKLTRATRDQLVAFTSAAAQATEKRQPTILAYIFKDKSWWAHFSPQLSAKRPQLDALAQSTQQFFEHIHPKSAGAMKGALQRSSLARLAGKGGLIAVLAVGILLSSTSAHADERAKGADDGDPIANTVGSFIGGITNRFPDYREEKGMIRASDMERARDEGRWKNVLPYSTIGPDPTPQKFWRRLPGGKMFSLLPYSTIGPAPPLRFWRRVPGGKRFFVNE